jgi:flavin reductase (DIM6/NTAB) family NADH-FMN oxidoreductase RutF
MTYENKTWNVAQDFKHFGINMLKNKIESFAQHIWLNNLVEVVYG